MFMSILLNWPVVLFFVAFILLAASAQAGAIIEHMTGVLREEDQDEFAFVLTATLTLLGLLIGFTFSMSVSRYDQRKTYEEEEANAIGTEYFRCGLLQSPDAAKLRGLLQQYLTSRVLFYKIDDSAKLARIELETSALESQMWAVVQNGAQSRPLAPMALVVSGMNDVFNSRGYTEAAWLNRIPTPAWTLMALIAICCNALLGYRTRRRDRCLLFILPAIIALAFFLIAEIDSPREGLIRVLPVNLLKVSNPPMG